MTASRIVVVGDIATDVVARLAEPLAPGSDATAAITSSGGGSGANVAAWLGHAGAAVSFVGVVGNDAPGRERSAELTAACVDLHLRQADAPTSTVIVMVEPDGERTMLPDRAANLALTPADLPNDLFATGHHLHLSGYTLFTDPPRAAGLHALKLARAAGMTVSVDPSSEEPLRRIGGGAFLEWTAGADICFPNAAEARELSGTVDLEDAQGVLADRYGQVVITSGPDGSLWTDGTRRLTHPAATGRARDTTGAGDAFAAGFLKAFAAGEGPEACLSAATSLAGVAIAVDGARPRLRSERPR